jgi:uncharacterized protein
VLDVLGDFVAELRLAGVGVSLTEHLDAVRALRHVDLADREALKAALGATLIKSAGHWQTFEITFELFFALVSEQAVAGEAADGVPGAEPRGAEASAPVGGGSGGDLTPTELDELVRRAMAQGDAGLMARAARVAVARYAGIEPGRPVAGTYYLYRTLRHLGLDALVADLLAAAAADAGSEAWTSLEERLVRDELEVRQAAMREAVESEIRRQLVADRGAAAVARAARRPLPEQVDIMHATTAELAALRAALVPLARKLAVRLARRRRHRRRGALDVRATIRRSLSSGGVPIEPRFRRPNPAKPDLMVVADISGSVASFARFTLHLVYAISSQFSRVRSFVFVDGIDEVTGLFDRASDPVDAVRRINAEAEVVWLDGHSDYGHALKSFAERWGDDVTPRTSLLVVGDARNNYHPSERQVLAALRADARHLYWLNPEPRAHWGSGDSIIGEYEPFCDAVVECRTLVQLERFIEALA